MGHYQPWIVLALLDSDGQADLRWLARQYADCEIRARLESRELSPKIRIRQAIRNVLQTEHGVVRLDGNTVHLVATYSQSDVPAVAKLCRNELIGRKLPPPQFVSGGLPSLGKRH
jgi:hypothetical protein